MIWVLNSGCTVKRELLANLIAFTRVLLAYTGIFTFLVSILNTWALVAQCNSVMPLQLLYVNISSLTNGFAG